MTNKKPWEEFPHIWKTKSSFLAWLRGSIRRACWNKSPIKLGVIKKQRKRVMNPKTGNEVWGGTCYVCGEDFLQKDLQVDHIVGEHSLKEISDIQSFVEAMTCLSENDLALICKSCHSCKTHSQRYGMTFEEAVIEKRLIQLMKMPVKQITELLDKHNLSSNNATVRKENLRKLLEMGEIE